MALQTSGAISLNEIHIEAGGTSGTTASINDADIRGLIDKGSGVQMSFSEWYGASAAVTLTSAATINGQSNRQQITASTYISSGGTLLIPANFWVWSDSTATAALIIDIPCTILNYGKIIGKGGDGRGGSGAFNQAGYAGGPAIKINSSISGVTITNYSGAYIAGGGGGGGTNRSYGPAPGAGGAGGGKGGNLFNFTGGAGGILNASGSNGTQYGSSGWVASKGGGSGGGGGAYNGSNAGWSAAGGGRILAGTGGNGANNNFANNGGGSAGSVGGSSTNAYYGGGGGGWGANGGRGGGTGGLGGSGGAAIDDSGNAYTLTNSGTIYGTT